MGSAAALAMSLATVGETRADQTLPDRYSINNMPYYSQGEKTYGCGAACVRMVLAYLGYTPVPSQSAMEGEVMITPGDIPADLMVKAFTSRGYGQVYYDENLSIDRLKRFIFHEIPTIALGGFAGGGHLGPRGHYVVVFGYDDILKEMIVHNPNGSPDFPWGYSDFDTCWTSSNCCNHQRTGIVVPYKGTTPIPIPT